MRKLLILFLLSNALFALEVGSILPDAQLSSKSGGLVAGGAWSTAMLKEKLHVIFYVDPDERDTNEALSKAIKAKNYDHQHFQALAIINMADTWRPNIILEALLKAKQEQYPNALYIKDKKHILIKKWALAHDSSDIIVTDSNKRVLFYKSGRLNDGDIQKLLALIDRELKRSQR